LYNSGTHCPLVVRIPEKFKALRPGTPGTKVNDLVSFIDMTKTWLTLCGAETPDYLQGKVFLGPEREKRDHHISFRGRMDERCDNVRAIRSSDGRFLYIRNYMPYAPWGQHLNYLWTMKATQAWEAHHKAGRTDAVTGRFFQTKPMEEFYDTSADPDNVVNLIDEPAHAAEIKRLSQVLDQWQLDHFDSGLLPESELVKRAEDCGKMIYDMVRDPQLYDLKSLQAAAATALGQDPENLKSFYKNLGSPDSGIRYWSTVGIFNLPGGTELDLDLIRMALEDDSHHVRIMAAWILYRAGEKEIAQKCWNDLLTESSYASLKIFNIIDWIGDGNGPYMEAMRACSFDHGGYVKRMQLYMGAIEEAPKKRRNRKK
ncbi:MAG: sulfatase, partial [Verrucomicrobiales bacterium]